LKLVLIFISIFIQFFIQFFTFFSSNLLVRKFFLQIVYTNLIHLPLHSKLFHLPPARFDDNSESTSCRYNLKILLFGCHHDIRPKITCRREIILYNTNYRNIHLTFFFRNLIDSTFFICTRVTAWRSTHIH